MARGRNASASDVRVLLEFLLHENNQLFLSQVAETLPVGQERTRQLLEDLEGEGYVDVNRSASNLYKISDEGFEYLARELRERVD